MRPVLTAAQMRAADRRTIEEVGLPGAVLMENAGAAVAAWLEARHPGAAVAVLCGKGNNGGDGFVVARRLARPSTRVYLAGARNDVKGDARLHLGVFERSGGTVLEIADEAAWRAVRDEVFRADVIVDALLGTGLAQKPTGIVGVVVGELATLSGRPALVAVDLPSGMSSDTGELPWPVPAAEATVTFGAAKCGHVLAPACDRIGELVVADIGIPRALLEQDARLWLLEETDAAQAFPARSGASHKGTYGHVLILAGSLGKTGAAGLAAGAALRAGVGLATVATPEPALPLVAHARLEAMTEPLPVAKDGGLGDAALERALALAKTRDAVVVGPGLGQEASTQAFVRQFVSRCPIPVVLDADGLNAFARPPGAKGNVAPPGSGRQAPTVLTPHPGEMSRLTGTPTDSVQRYRLETARSYALESGTVVVLKGQRTIVADAEGRAAVNPTGNPGMATGGTGDVLAGIIGALLAKGSDGWMAATAGVYLHGRAGDEAARRLGEESLVAGDVVEALPSAITALARRPRR